MSTSLGQRVPVANDSVSSTTTKERDLNKFYNIVSEYTEFNGDELCLNYQYFKTSVVGSIDWVGFLNYSKVQFSNGIEISKAVLQFNDQNCLGYSLAKQDMITLIIRLYIAEDGRNTISQINNKIMNLRTKNTLPFTYLFKNGLIEKAGSPKKSKSAFALNAQQNTNLKKKNQNIIKALTKFNNNRNLFETTSLADQTTDFEFISEPERWIAAMIRRHGQKMTKFLDVCVKNIVTSFTEELESRKMWNEIQSINSQPEASRIEVALRMMVQIVSSKADNIDNANNFAQAFYSVQEKRSGRYKEKWVAQQSRNIKKKIYDNVPTEQSISWLMDEIMSQPVTQPTTAISSFLPDSRSDNVLDTFDQLLMTLPPINTDNSVYRPEQHLQQHRSELPLSQVQHQYTPSQHNYQQTSLTDSEISNFMPSLF